MTSPKSAPTEVPEARRSLVLLHGWGMHSGIWGELLGQLRGQLGEAVEITPIELPGHGGQSQAPADLDAWAAACLAQAPERAVWLGWSLGGLVALAAALRAPRRVGALILLTTTPRFVRAVDWSPALPLETLEQFHAGLASDGAETLARFLALQVQGDRRGRETLRVLRRAIASRPPPQPAALSAGLDLLREEDLRGRLADIRCPALWLFGARDTLVPAAVAERVEWLMPGATTHLIADAAHAPHLSHPVVSAAAIRDFFAGLARSATAPDEAAKQRPSDPQALAWCSPCLRVAPAPTPTPTPGDPITDRSLSDERGT